MQEFCDAAPNTPKLANMLEGGSTPILPPKELEAMGFKIAAYPLTLMSTAVNAMNRLLLPFSLDFSFPIDILAKNLLSDFSIWRQLARGLLSWLFLLAAP
jgi:hypothetical protein